jgi:soluble cytochrome b562
MTKEEAMKHLIAKLECLTRSKGFREKCDSYNSYEGCYECDLGYKQGNIGEQIESLNLAIKALEQEDTLDNMRADLSNAIQDTVEELNHIATEPYDVDDYQEGVTDGIQLAIRTINAKIKDCKNSGGNVTNEEIEEAIDLLDNLIGVVEDNHNSDYDKAIKMGIEALKRLSNTSNDERR